MDNELIFRQAQSCETDRIMQIIRQAQARMHAAGMCFCGRLQRI